MVQFGCSGRLSRIITALIYRVRMTHFEGVPAVSNNCILWFGELHKANFSSNWCIPDKSLINSGKYLPNLNEWNNSV